VGSRPKRKKKKWQCETRTVLGEPVGGKPMGEGNGEGGYDQSTLYTL
jgi:hypothetical protein